MLHFTFSSLSNQSEFSFSNYINLIISGFKKHCLTEYIERERERERERKREREIAILNISSQAPIIFSQHAISFLFGHIIRCSPSRLTLMKSVSLNKLTNWHWINKLIFNSEMVKVVNLAFCIINDIPFPNF